MGLTLNTLEIGPKLQIDGANLSTKTKVVIVRISIKLVYGNFL